MKDRRSIAAILLAPLFLAGLQERKPASRPAPEKEGLVRKVLVIGASVSDGYFRRLVDLAIRVPHKKVGSETTQAFFFDPIRLGRRIMTRTLRRGPTLVIALDFLFWYGYGHPRTKNPEAELLRRMKKLEVGLRELSRYEGPLVLGDLPDMRGADPRILNPVLIPSLEVLGNLNERIRSWVEARRRKGQDILLLPLHRWIREMKEGKVRLPASKDGRHRPFSLPEKSMMSWDGLHPNRIGAIVLLHRIVGAMKVHFGKETEKGLSLDPWEVLERKGLAAEVERLRKKA